MTEFDVSRAILLGVDRLPLHVKATRPLREALADKAVHNDTPVVVLRREMGTVVLLTRQMSYHHVSQCDMAGDPWMVAF